MTEEKKEPEPGSWVPRTEVRPELPAAWGPHSGNAHLLAAQELGLLKGMTAKGVRYDEERPARPRQGRPPIMKALLALSEEDKLRVIARANEVAARATPCPRCGRPIPWADVPGSYPGQPSHTDDVTEICKACWKSERREIEASLQQEPQPKTSWKRPEVARPLDPANYPKPVTGR